MRVAPGVLALAILSLTMVQVAGLPSLWQVKVDQGFVIVGWAASTDPSFHRYELWLRSAGGEWRNVRTILDRNITSTTVLGLASGETYELYLRVYDGSGFQDSPVLTVRTPGAPGGPGWFPLAALAVLGAMVAAGATLAWMVRRRSRTPAAEEGERLP